MSRRLSVPEAAEYIGMSRRFVYQLVEDRVVTFYKIGKSLRFDTDDLDAYMAANRVEAGSRPA